MHEQTLACLVAGAAILGGFGGSIGMRYIFKRFAIPILFPPDPFSLDESDDDPERAAPVVGFIYGAIPGGLIGWWGCNWTAEGSRIGGIVALLFSPFALTVIYGGFFAFIYYWGRTVERFADRYRKRHRKRRRK